ncbi:MAG: hydroxymethylbilane synthase [Megasphaera sp.]|nr:hydroxymethylbilane synthase [Megasphaera sp.]MCH4188138.1 hydroxymethylbilane synthase [Megasphaera sp.]MCH4217976.1 hydroxymethylbilane synthase [Megasphaera sp.]
MQTHIRIGTRKSSLAMWQAEYIANQLRCHSPSCTVELIPILTKGDRLLHEPLARIGGKGLFIKELENAMIDGRIDAAVHSLKDVPALLPPELVITAITTRADCHDAFVSNRYASLDDLPSGAIVGTSSLRRQAQLLHYRPDLAIHTLRGNVNTRLHKLDNNEYDAIILAQAGLLRLGLSARITQTLPDSIMLPACGQGALAVECRKEDYALRQLLSCVNNEDMTTIATAERSFSACIGGSCQVPAGACGILDGDTLTVTALIASPDGRRLYRRSLSGSRTEAAILGNTLGNALLTDGGAAILQEMGISPSPKETI